ncbi:3-sulpholactaldehyde reductase [Gammaproteobacteria bacterium]|nr:3-sulpholactaldehyde reductase [Gammaproteobacteria bacterium]
MSAIMPTIGFIGLGQMGQPMAANLIKGGFKLRVYDVNPKAGIPLAASGAIICKTPSEAAQDADFIITMLPNGDLVRNVLFGADGAINKLNKNALVIDMSTIHPLQTDQLIADLKAHGIQMMDAPVGRTSEQAITGNLLILAGGSADQITKATPLFNLMGSEIINAGGPGMGIRVKIINNYMSIALNSLSAEAATLCEGLGLNFDTALQVMSGTPAGKGHFTTSWANKVLKGDLSPAFMIDHAHKDIGLALDVANTLHVAMPMGAAAREVYSQARAAGRGKQDWSAILEQVRHTSGMEKKI